MANYAFIQPLLLIANVQRRKVMCDRKNISANEFFAADKASGLKPKYILRVRSFEYRQEKQCEMDGIIYSIYRVYSTDEGMTELYIAPKAGEQRA